MQKFSFCNEYNIERLIFFCHALGLSRDIKCIQRVNTFGAMSADIIDTKYEAAYNEINILWKKFREIYKNLRAAGHHPSSRSHKGKVFRVNEF